MRRALLLLVTAAACAGPPGPVAGPRSEPVRTARSVTELAGEWVSSENLDWHMTIDRAGTIDVWIDRDVGGRCEQKGTIARGKADGEFRLLYTTGACNPAVLNVPLDATISGFTGKRLTIVVADQRRDYERASQAGDDSDQPAALRGR